MPDPKKLECLSRNDLIHLVIRLSQQVSELSRLHFGTRSERHAPSPAEQIVHEISPEDRLCPCCNAVRPELGEIVSEELEYQPARYVVHKHVRRTYGECRCEEFVNSGEPGVLTTALPRLIPGSQLSSSTMAALLTGKFVDGLPFYRQEAISQRHGHRISRNTMAYMALRVSEKLSVLVDMMSADQRGSPVLRCDETTLQVLKEPGRKAQTQSYAWVVYGYKDDRPIVIWRYFPGRNKEYAQQLLQNYQGYVQTDGYTGYTKAASEDGIIHVGCWAHIHRGFKKAFDLSDGCQWLAPTRTSARCCRMR